MRQRRRADQTKGNLATSARLFGVLDAHRKHRERGGKVLKQYGRSLIVIQCSHPRRLEQP